MTTPLVIALAGRIDSGKSTVAGILSADLKIPVVSFGAYVRSRSPPEASREELQKTGSKLLDTLGSDGLVAAVLRNQDLGDSDSAVWEGLRHRSVLQSLRTLYAPTSVNLFFLGPPEPERLARVAEEAGSAARLEDWESHSTEHVEELLAEADLVVADSTPEEAAAEILAQLGRRQ